MRNVLVAIVVLGALAFLVGYACGLHAGAGP